MFPGEIIVVAASDGLYRIEVASVIVDNRDARKTDGSAGQHRHAGPSRATLALSETEENRQVPKKQYCRRRRASGGSQHRCVRRRAPHKDHVWSYDFLTDHMEDEQKMWPPVVIDIFAREYLPSR